jgi:PPP family 3-phenylpropionic acid transporter
MRRAVSPATSLQVLFILFGIAIAAFFPFFALFLNGRGLSAGEIGVVIATTAVARVLCNPVWGHLSDSTLGRRRALQIGTLGSAIAAFGLFFTSSLGSILVVVFVFATMSAATGPNVDALALVHLGDDQMHQYGRVRGWESLSYAASCLVFGFVLQLVGARWAMPIYGAAAILVLLWSSTLVQDRPTRSEHQGRLGTVGAAFRAAPRFWVFLIALLLVWIGFNAAWNFISLKIEAAGGGPLLVGIGTALGGLVEVPVMRSSSRLVRRYGLRVLYVTGCCVYALGFLLWGLISNPTIVSLLTVFEGLGFGLLFTTGVLVIGRMLPSSLYSTGQSMAATASFGLGPILGAGIGGWVFDRFGSVTLYTGASLLALAGATVAWFALSPSSLSASEAVPITAPA